MELACCGNFRECAGRRDGDRVLYVWLLNKGNVIDDLDFLAQPLVVATRMVQVIITHVLLLESPSPSKTQHDLYLSANLKPSKWSTIGAGFISKQANQRSSLLFVPIPSSLSVPEVLNREPFLDALSCQHSSFLLPLPSPPFNLELNPPCNTSASSCILHRHSPPM